MKRILVIFLSALLSVLGLSACNSSTDTSSSSSNDKISVVTTIFPQYDFVRQIAGDNVELTMLLPPGSESHSFEPTPQDIITIESCDVFIYVGGESDAWVDEILDSMDTSSMQIISMMGYVDVVEEEILEGMETDEEHGNGTSDYDDDDEVEYDEHVWTSLRNSESIVQAISDKLCEIDGNNAETYKTNTEVYIKELSALDAELKGIADNAKRKTIVFGDRFPFRYFADDYGLTCFAAFPGCSTETEASAETVAFLIDKVSDENLPVVFFIEFSNQKMADTISEGSNAKPLLLHSCHNISANDFNNGVTYLELMKQNAVNLKEALN